MQPALRKIGTGLVMVALAAGCGDLSEGRVADSSVDGVASAEGGQDSTADSGCATLTVTVIDDTNGPVKICNATVNASGPTQVTLEPVGGQGSCNYQGSVKGGTYEITVTATGYERYTTPITIEPCFSPSISIDVTPAP